METAMRNESNPRSRHTQQDRRGRTRRETEDEQEVRLGRELRHLMQDPRYMEGDPDYRAFVHRQYRRVYDDPKGEPAPLRIGRPQTFTDHVEPFDPPRERRLRLGAKEPGESSGVPGQTTQPSRGTILGRVPMVAESAERRTVRSSAAATNRRQRVAEASSTPQPDFEILPPSERAMSGLEENARRHGLDPVDARRARLDRLEREKGEVRRAVQEQLGQQGDSVRNTDLDRGEISQRLEQTGRAIDAMIASWRRDGSILGAEFLQRYRDGVGGVRPISWGRLMTYSKFRHEQGRLKGHYLNWVRDKLDDDLWTPFLELEDGESIRVSTNEAGKPLKLTVNWDPLTIGSAFNRSEGSDRDFARAIGQGEIESFGDLTFTRHGEIIFVSGIVDMKLNEEFNFEPGFLPWLDSIFGSDGPSATNEEFEEYETLGPAKEFLSTSQKIWQVTGRIVLRDDGTPDPRETVLFWSEADREESGR
jgi:hypothetical protein